MSSATLGLFLASAFPAVILGPERQLTLGRVTLAFGERDLDGPGRSEEHTSELQSRVDIVCRLLLEKNKHKKIAQKRLGHAKITTILDLYSHVNDMMHSDAAERLYSAFFFFFNATAATEISTLSLHGALPI